MLNRAPLAPIVLSVLLLTLVAGCGGSSSSSSPTGESRSAGGELTKAEFIEQGDAICEESHKRGAAYEEEVEELVKGGNTPKAKVGVATVLKDSLPVAEGFQKEFAELTPPAEDQPTIDHIEELQKETFENSEELAEALEEGEEAKVEEVEARAEKEKATERGLDQGYGFKVCGQEEE